MKNFTKQTRNIEMAREVADKKITENAMSVFLQVGKEWQSNHPKRHLKLITGMGAAFWTIDGDILHLDKQQYSTDSWFTISYREKFSCDWAGWKNHGLSDHDKQSQFAALAQAFDWLNDLLMASEYLDGYLSDIDFKNL